jgi:hypothetical protein
MSLADERKNLKDSFWFLKQKRRIGEARPSDLFIHIYGLLIFCRQYNNFKMMGANTNPAQMGVTNSASIM